MGVDKIVQAEVPGIIMIGSALTFYMVLVSEELIHAINTGQHPTLWEVKSLLISDAFTDR